MRRSFARPASCSPSRPSSSSHASSSPDRARKVRVRPHPHAHEHVRLTQEHADLCVRPVLRWEVLEEHDDLLWKGQRGVQGQQR